MRFAVITLSALFSLVTFADSPGLTPLLVNKTVESHGKDIRDCYKSAQKPKIIPRGTLDVAFTIQKDGSASDIKVVHSTLVEGKDLQECLLKQLKSWRFDKAPSITEVPDYPFQFHPM